MICDPGTAAMFTNQRAAETDGDFTTIFGAYVYNWYTGQEDRSIYTVDCRVSYGWVSITNAGWIQPSRSATLQFRGRW